MTAAKALLTIITTLINCDLIINLLKSFWPTCNTSCMNFKKARAMLKALKVCGIKRSFSRSTTFGFNKISSRFVSLMTQIFCFTQISQILIKQQLSLQFYTKTSLSCWKLAYLIVGPWNLFIGEIFDAFCIFATNISAPKRLFIKCWRFLVSFSTTVNLFGSEIPVAEIQQASKISSYFYYIYIYIYIYIYRSST